MTIDEARAKYPALMSYIEGRSPSVGAEKWDMLRADEAAAFAGQFADVAAQLTQAQADYGRYPYNSAMGEFLGLPLRTNGEPASGYYMAGKVRDHFRLGEATREADCPDVLLLVALNAKDVRFWRLPAISGASVVVLRGERDRLQAENAKLRAALALAGPFMEGFEGDECQGDDFPAQLAQVRAAMGKEDPR